MRETGEKERETATPEASIFLQGDIREIKMSHFLLGALVLRVVVKAIQQLATHSMGKRG